MSSWETSGNLGTDYEQLMVPAMFGPWAVVMAEFVEADLGERVLDVACGTGVVARELVGCVGPKGTVVGCDSNATMLATARDVAPEIDWREGNALDLPFESDCFDIVTCQQGYQFFPDRVQAAREAYRVLVGGGRLAVAVWCSLSENPGHAAVVSAVQEFVGPAEAEIVGSPFALGDKSVLVRDFAEAGFELLQSTTKTHPSRFPSPDALTLGLVRGGALARAGVDLEEDTITQILERVKTTLAGYQGVDELACPMSANMILAKK
jgi:SAM-dependent methyltransferase